MQRNMLSDTMDFIEDYLGGYRYFGYWSNSKRRGNQIKTHSKEETIDLLNDHNGRDNCGISITTFVKGMPKLLFLPFDFDSDNNKEAFDDAYKLYNFIIDAGYNAMLNSSGKKGYHVLVQTEPKTYGKKQLNNIQLFFKRILDLKTSDPNIESDIRRLIRIPGTLHICGSMCWTVLSREDGNRLDIAEYSSPEENQYELEDFEVHDYNLNHHIYHDYPCIEGSIKEEEPRQFVRFCWVIEQLAKEKTEEEMLDFAREYWIDYNTEYSLYQIRFISSKKYSHPSCEKIQDMGFCKGESCPYYNEWKGLKSERNISKV